VPVRLDPGHRAAVAVGVAVLVVAVVTGAWLLASRPRPVDVSGDPTPIAGATPPRGSAAASRADAPATGAGAGAGSGAAPAGEPAPASSSSEDVVVDVAGKVVRPGLYHLKQGARVADAVSAAGGPRHGVDLTSVNLAARVSDGQQIVIGLPAGAVPAGAGAGTADSGSPAQGGAGGAGGGAPVNLNTATLEQLETLPGIGPALGQRILDFRTTHGPFSSVDQLNDVSGIGEVKFAGLKGLVTV